MYPLLYPDGRPVNSVVAKFTGGGITRLTISDPIVYDYLYPNGTVEAQGFWQIDSINVDWTPDATYQECNCNRPVIPRPLPQFASSPDWDGDGVLDWKMDVEVSDNDGLVLRNVRLNDRYMAEKISIPYYLLQLNPALPGGPRGELKR